MILLLGALAGFILWIGYQKGFFQWPMNREWVVPVRLIHVVGAFAIYIAITFISASIFVSLLKSHLTIDYIAYSSWFNFLASLLILLSLLIYMKCIPHLQGILYQSSYSPKEDILNALFAWVLAFPLVLFLSEMIELIVFRFFSITRLPDQLAVLFLKATFSQPLYLTLAVFSIVILAPLIEETLFRGFLQSFIRQHLGSRQAIFITSACFSFFHYSKDQGLGNIPIIFSLFVLSLFLGFLYEKRKSLLAPVALHACFNTISVINLYFMGGFAIGL